ncbi:fungal specific transcription factor domain-containing protein [Aspergillus affinis]|uniref:fungal specific transcription factor domain-containing protein n=1 Tax=Aspergillus affinis TaxID=1070780 RepID=UPI0022FE2383|nr:uncharacterized protein KD926_000438 [Aspergillus affinis]KAI9044527.1 hypothetical protein KD926_000438 [Aspergillus affinis]
MESPSSDGSTQSFIAAIAEPSAAIAETQAHQKWRHLTVAGAKGVGFHAWNAIGEKYVATAMIHVEAATRSSRHFIERTDNHLPATPTESVIFPCPSEQDNVAPSAPPQDSPHDLERNYKRYNDEGTSTNRQYVRGTLSKGRFLGNTHPITTYLQCDEMRRTVNHTPHVVGRKETNRSELLSEAHSLIASAKATARVVKRQQTPLSLSVDGAACYLPPQEISDTLIRHYMRVIEGPFRIIHTGTFQQEYAAFWGDHTKRGTLFTVIICLMMSIGIKFCDDETIETLIRPHIHEWVQTAEVCLSRAKYKEIATISGLQAQCLLSVLLRLGRNKPEEIWLLQGKLLRTATCMGLHRDGSHFPGMSFYQAEMRRRLWSTILELDLQAAMDLGHVPTMNERSFDCLPPSNLNDDAFDKTTQRSITEMPQSKPTQASLQITLQNSLATRMKICRLMNDSFNEPSYDDILQEASSLGKLLATNEAYIGSFPEELGMKAVHRNLAIFLTRRFLLATHRPFAQKSLGDRQFYYSRKVCLDNALILLSCDPDSDYDQILLESVTYFQHIMHHAAIVVCLETIWQLKEDQMDKRLFELHRKDRACRLAFVEKVQRLAIDRLHAGETNVKAHVFLHMAVAQIEAMENGLDITEYVTKASTAASQYALEILQKRNMTNADSSRLLGSVSTDQGLVNLGNISPFSMPGPDKIDLELGDIANWLFSDWVYEDAV